MANQKISALIAITGAAVDSAADFLAIVDTSATETKKITPAELRTGIGAQPLDATLTALAAVTTAADKVIYATGSDTFTTADLTSLARTLLAVAAPSAVRFYKVNADNTISLRTAAEMLSDIGAQAAGTYLVASNNLSDIANAATARANLGLAIGTNVQAYDAELAAIAGLTSASDSFPYFTGSGTAGLLVIVSAIRTILASTTVANFRTNAGLGTGDSPQFTGIELGHATDTTITRVSAGVAAIEGVNILTTGTGIAKTSVPFTLTVAASDETTALTTGTGKVTFRAPHAMTLTEVRATLTTAQTSGSTFTVDINESGTTILSTKLTIDNTEKTSTTAAAAAVIADTAIADDAEITIDIDQVGDGTAKGLKVTLIGTRSV